MSKHCPPGPDVRRGGTASYACNIQLASAGKTGTVTSFVDVGKILVKS